MPPRSGRARGAQVDRQQRSRKEKRMAREPGPIRGARAASPQRRGSERDVERGLHTAVRSAEIGAAGMVEVLRSVAVGAVTAVRDVGSEIGVTAVQAIRGTVRGGAEIGGDIKAIAADAVKGAVTTAGDLVADVRGMVRP